MNDTALIGRYEIERSLSSVRNLRLMPVNGISLSLDAAGTLYAENEGDVFHLDGDARKGMLRHVGISDKCISEIAVADEGLASDVITTLYRNKVEEDVFAMRGNTPVDFGPVDSFNFLSVDDDLGSIEEAIGKDVRFRVAP
jgi:hypothetical protein